MRRVFEPFYTTKEIGKGTGLGLSMVYGFVQQSGGHIRILSAPNEGTTIELYFPADQTTHEVPELIERRAKPDVPSLRRGNGELILLVDDDPLVRETMAAFLKRLNYTIVEAEDGHVALTKLSEMPAIAAMLSDIGLPDGMNGFDLARAAARRHPDLKMLFMSGLANNYKEGPNELPSGAVLMSKPFRMADLGARLSDLLGEPQDNTG